MGRVKGKVPVTVYIPERLWENIRRISPDLPTGKKKVSDMVAKLLELGLEVYGVRTSELPEERSDEPPKSEGEKRGEKPYEVEVEGVKLFLRPLE